MASYRFLSNVPTHNSDFEESRDQKGSTRTENDRATHKLARIPNPKFTKRY